MTSKARSVSRVAQHPWNQVSSGEEGDAEVMCAKESVPLSPQLSAQLPSSTHLLLVGWPRPTPHRAEMSPAHAADPPAKWTLGIVSSHRFFVLFCFFILGRTAWHVGS